MKTFVKTEIVDTSVKENHSLPLCAGEIAGASPFHHSILAGGKIDFPGNAGFYRIFILITGKAEFATAGETYSYAERTVFVPAPDAPLTVSAATDVAMLEIRWDIIASDAEELKQYGTVFPIRQPYWTSKQYTDPNKSEKTISRVMIEQRNIPRFAIGSVETYGVDSVRSHAHAMLDQFFFSFPENDIDVLINGEAMPMGGDIIMHIPLGADHGVNVAEGKHCHYMWIDFMVDDTAMKRLDTSHRPTGKMRSFDGESK